jgi:hypothetical protein
MLARNHARDQSIGLKQFLKRLSNVHYFHIIRCYVGVFFGQYSPEKKILDAFFEGGELSYGKPEIMMQYSRAVTMI